MKKINIIFIVLLLIILGDIKLNAQQTVASPTSVNGWEVLPSVDINGNWFFDKENTFSRLGNGFQTFTISGNTHLNGGMNYIKVDNSKNFSNILSTENRKLKKFIGFKYRISKLVGNISEVVIRIGVQDNGTYISSFNMNYDISNPSTHSEWKEVNLETKDILSYLTSFTQLRFETWAISPGIEYVSLSFDVEVLFGEDSLGTRTIYDGFDITKVDEKTELPKSFALNQNYPNPFNPTTKISFSLPESGIYSLKVYNMLGQEVQILIDNKFLAPGLQETTFDGSGLPSGLYIYHLSGKNVSLSKKMMLIK